VWGIVPAAGAGSRIQPLAFSKELLPVGSRIEEGVERPRAVSEYLVERMLLAGVTRFCFVISPGKSDIVEYYGSRIGSADACFTVQPEPAGLCDAIFRAAPFIASQDRVAIGLPDTIWFPEDALSSLPADELSFLLFPVDRPELFDAVRIDSASRILEVQVKCPDARTPWVWGALTMPGRVLHELRALWMSREPRDEYLGTLVNGYLAAGGRASGIRAGSVYIDVGTLHGYREAIALLRTHPFGEPLGRASGGTA
jgi:glucose-1-phosphate thymidylyltransferase